MTTETADVVVVPAGTPLVWEEVPRPPGDTAPPGYEAILFRSSDRRFSCGFWRRVPEQGALDPPYDEIMLSLEGRVEVTRQDGRVLRIAPGDVLAAPNGSVSRWHSLAPVRKFWLVHHGEDERRAPEVLPGDAVALGDERVAFESGDGAFRASLLHAERLDQPIAPERDEVAYVLDGALEVSATTAEATAGPGDVVVVPRGRAGRWSSPGPVRLFRGAYGG